MKISEVQIIPIKPKDGLVAFASFVIDDSVYCGSVAIMTRPNGDYRLLYPTKKISGRDISLYYPISKDVGVAIQEAVITKYEDVMKEDANDRYGSFKP
jgi:stage V sporulation protein G